MPPNPKPPTNGSPHPPPTRAAVDLYFSADVETDGPIPGPYSMLSFGIAVAGSFDGQTFRRPEYPATFYRELKPISGNWEAKALEVSGLDRARLQAEGHDPAQAMREASAWIASVAEGAEPVLVAYPLSFDWTWLYWYFVNFTKHSPFGHSRCFDIKTAYAVKARRCIAGAGRAGLPAHLLPDLPHTHNALDDALEQAEIFARVFEWEGSSCPEKAHVQ